MNNRQICTIWEVERLAAGGDGYRAGVFVWHVTRDLRLELAYPDEGENAESLPDQPVEPAAVLV